jgi:hypoxanthine phosphoribosyltransferase
MENPGVENQLNSESRPKLDFSLKELELLESEWQETRSSIDRFDKICVDLRKYGFSLITFMITASSIAFEATGLTSVLPVLIVPFSIMTLICGLFLADRYYEVLLLACVLRSRQLEDTSQGILETKSSVYHRLNLTTFLEDNVQKTRAHLFSLLIYLLFIAASFLLGFFSLMAYFQQAGKPASIGPLIVLVVFGVIALFFLFTINHTMASLVSRIRSDVIIDDRIIIRKLFREDQVSEAFKRLASEVDFAFRQTDFKILTLGIGGLYVAPRLIGELKRRGRTNIESISVFARRIFISESSYRVEIEAPERHLLQDRDILIVDDLVATGLTLWELTSICKANGARSVRSCILLDAPNRRKAKNIRIDFKGLTTAETDLFVGCGMDVNYECRELPYIGIVKSYKPKRIS